MLYDRSLQGWDIEAFTIEEPERNIDDAWSILELAMEVRRQREQEQQEVNNGVG